MSSELYYADIELTVRVYFADDEKNGLMDQAYNALGSTVDVSDADMRISAMGKVGAHD